MSDARQFRKKPVVIEAVQWTGENLREIITFTDGSPETRTQHAGMMWEQYEDLVAADGLIIFTLEGKHIATIGDWIIKGVKGEHYPCKPDVFAMTYEPASDGQPPARDEADARAGALLAEAWGDFLALHTAAFAVLTWFENARPDLIGPRIEKLRDVLKSEHFRPDPDATAALACAIAKAREDALEEAAKLLDKRMEQLVADYGSYEPDTNVTNLPEWVTTAEEELEPMAAAIRAIAGEVTP